MICACSTETWELSKEREKDLGLGDFELGLNDFEAGLSERDLRSFHFELGLTDAKHGLFEHEFGLKKTLKGEEGDLDNLNDGLLLDTKAGLLERDHWLLDGHFGLSD